MRRPVLTIYFLLLAFTVQAGGLRLSPTFGTGMVLQQQTEVEIWGWAEAGDRIEVTSCWGSHAMAVTGPDGRWTAAIQTPAASMDSHTLKVVCGPEVIELADVLIGDVWIVGGQSNMQMDFRGNPDQPVENAQKILLRARHEGIRLFRVEPGYSLAYDSGEPVNGQWYSANPDNVKLFSVVGYIFGEKIHELTGIPIGLVQSAHGGSTAEAWIDRATLERFGGFELDSPHIDPIWYAFSPSLLYNKMLAPLLPMSVKGTIWYQGESNVDRPVQYRDLFPELIRAWRGYFRNEDMPFYYVQIAPYNHGNANSAYLREVQLGVMDMVENTGMAVTLDVGEPDIIHPARKEVIGERLAYWALNRDYGFGAFECRGPELKSMEVTDGRALLKFEYAPNGLSFFGKEPSAFEIAGADRKFYPAQTRIAPSFWGNDGLEVWSGEVPEPVAVRYGFTNYIDGCLYNTAGLPASSFRTDTWEE